MTTLPLLASASFTLLAAWLVLFHLAAMLGAPLGRYTLGGRWPGPLPALLRPLSLAQAAIAIVMASAVLDASGLVGLDWPAWAHRATIALCAVSVLANAATPSGPERRLGLPVAFAMLIAASVAGWT